MRIVQINATCGQGSTGNICLKICRCLSDNSIENYVFYAVGKSSEKKAVKYADSTDIRLAAAYAHISGAYGFVSSNITKKLIKRLKEVDPDIVHLHNIHSHNCNLRLLFEYFSVNKIKVIWTFHDCWAFTGYCTHFLMSCCDKWKTGCGSCPQYRHYSLFFDRSAALFNKKRELFASVDLTIVTPSQWLANIVKQSFLSSCPVKVIHNGIDLSVFKPVKSDFRDKHGISGVKCIVLGAAYNWSKKKGIDVFQELSRRIDKSKYQIVLVGLTDEQTGLFSDDVIAVPLLGSSEEMAQLYCSADVFVNPTREDTFPTVNLEAVSCGTPVITSDVGGCPETVGDDTGIVVPKGNIDGIIKALERIKDSGLYNRKKCRDYAEKHFDEDTSYQKYMSLYRELLSREK